MYSSATSSGSMEKTRACHAFLGALLLCLLAGLVASPASEAAAAKKKVLVVMSYHPGYGGEEKTKQGIEDILSDAEISYFWLDTKYNYEGGAAAAKKAFSLYRELKPDAVIAADDNAQAMFVVPYLRDKVSTPVVFCGVNNDASRYGYPASNVTGILEKKHYRESISFAQIISPEIKRLAIVYKDSSSNRENLAQIESERKSYTADIVDITKVETVDDTVKAVRRLEHKADALLTLNITGILNAQKKSLDGAESVSLLTRYWKKPTITDSAWQLRAGYLCGVIKQMYEQGTTAARMVKDILGGKPLDRVPVAQNKNGLRMINMKTARSLGLVVPPEAAIGTSIIFPREAE